MGKLLWQAEVRERERLLSGRSCSFDSRRTCSQGHGHKSSSAHKNISPENLEVSVEFVVRNEGAGLEDLGGQIVVLDMLGMEMVIKVVCGNALVDSGRIFGFEAFVMQLFVACIM